MIIVSGLPRLVLGLVMTDALRRGLVVILQAGGGHIGAATGRADVGPVIGVGPPVQPEVSILAEALEPGSIFRRFY